MHVQIMEFANAVVTSRIVDALNACYPPLNYGARRSLAYDAALNSPETTKFTPEGIPLAGDSMTYGEFDVELFNRALERVRPTRGETFVDVGSGVGRLVLAAALLHPRTWANCHGVEISSPLHDAAVAARVAFEEVSSSSDDDDDGPLSIAPCQYTLSDFGAGEGLRALEEADVVFSYAVTWNHDESHRRLVRTLARCLRDGARVVSVDLPLTTTTRDDDDESDARFDLVAKEVGYNEDTGDDTVAFVYKLSRGR